VTNEELRLLGEKLEWHQKTGL